MEWEVKALWDNKEEAVKEEKPKQQTKRRSTECLIRETRNIYRRAFSETQLLDVLGDKFHFAVESSANINTNPRTENGCITIGEDIYKFYREYFDGINSFE